MAESEPPWPSVFQVPDGNQRMGVPFVTLPTTSTSVSGTVWPSDTIPAQIINTPQPQIFRSLGFHEAFMLATLPRRRWDETSQAAFWAGVATLTSAVAGFADLISGKPQTPLLSLAEVMIFVICAAVFVERCINAQAEQTSREYLEELRTGIKKPPTKSRWWHFW